MPSPRVRVWVTGSRLGCRKSPRASAWSERAIRSFPVFFMRPSRILFVQKEGWFAEPSSASLGRWVLAWLQEEPSSLCSEKEGDQEFSCIFCAALAHPFHSEGGVECAKLPSVGVSSDTSGELLSGKSKWRPVPHSIGVAWWSRDTLQKYQRASLVGSRAVRLALGARCLPTVGSHSETSLPVSDMT